MSLRYIFSPGTSGETVLTSEEIVRQNPIRTHTGKADCEATLAIDDSLRSTINDHARRQDRVDIEINGIVDWTGYAISTSHNQRTGQTLLRLEGVAKRLEETRPDYDSLGGSLTYRNIALEDAIDDYWGRTPFDNYTVPTQSTEVVADDDNVQSLSSTSDFNNAISIPSDRPFRIQNNQLQLAQTSFVREGENPSNTTPAFVSDGGFSNGDAAVIGTDTNQSYEYPFTLDYTIPADDFAVAARWSGPGSGATNADIVWELDGEEISRYNPAGNFGAISWEEDIIDAEGSRPSSDLAAGQHTVRIYTESTGDQWELDVVQSYDRGTRFGGFSYFYDDDNGGNDGYLDGPELYPNGVSIEWNPLEVSYNITGARVDSEWIDDEVSGAQQIEFSNDDGDTWEVINNSEDGSVSFDASSGRAITARTTHDRYGSTTGQTPLEGIEGQAVDMWDLFLDGNTKVVLDELELSRDNFSNLQQLHSYGNFIWVISHDSGSIANMQVTSFLEGDVTRPTPNGFDDPQNKNAEVQAGNYFNSIYLQGAEDENGNRPTAEVSDQDAINNDGREISPGVLRDPKVTTEAGATFRARSLLSTALSNNDLKGTVTVPPTELNDPGFAREVVLDQTEGEIERTVEEVALTEQPDNVQMRYRFGLPEDLSEEISELKRNARDLGDKV